MRRTGTPHIVNATGAHYLLRRVDLADRRIAEDFLQESLHKSPEILPVGEFDPSFTPLISLGREINAIDNLFISPNGKITLVETKLWRNPEAAREVVAQLLDYATQLSSWSYADLEQAVQSALPSSIIGGRSLYEYIAQKCPDDALPEQQFIDEVQKNLRTARFLLMVVGDGIRENLEQLLAHLHRQPQLLYTFCLVELQIYENPDLFEGRLLLPMLVAHTTEIVRAVVRVETTGQAQVTVAIEEAGNTSAAVRRTLSEEVFFEELQDECAHRLFQRLLEFASEIGAVKKWGASSVSIQLPDPRGSKQNLTLFVLTTTGVLYTGWLGGQLEKVSLDRQIAYDFVSTLASMFAGLTPHRKYPESLSRNIEAIELEPKIEPFMNLVRETVTRISGS